MRRTQLLLLLTIAAAAAFLPAAHSPAAASTSAAIAIGDDQATRACLTASGLRGATLAGGPLMFSDTMDKTAVLVTGRWKPAHMKRARATMLCLYDRRSKKAETVESVGWLAPAK